MRILRLHLKGEYWDAIRDGDKTEEYRLVCPYWMTRLVGREYDEIHLLRGYPKRGDESKTLRRKWNGYDQKTLRHKNFGDELVEVFVIDVSENSFPDGWPCGCVRRDKEGNLDAIKILPCNVKRCRTCGAERPEFGKYYCSGCKRLLERDSDKPYLMRFCEKAGRFVRMKRI